MEVDPFVPAQEIQKHDTLWFEDGNIVIVTGNVGFRVYRGVLARKSAVFRDLFNLPQPPDSEVFEECPVVRLHDPAADMARFLGVLYDGLSVWQDNQYFSWPLTRSIVVLSNKYEIDDLRQTGIERLRERFPGKIEDWETTYEETVLGEPRDVISMANVARLLGLFRIHARALYHCCQLPTADLVDGVVNSDNVYEVLCSEDLKTCVSGLARLGELYLRHQDMLKDMATNPDYKHAKCSGARLQLAGLFQWRSTRVQYDVLAADEEFQCRLADMCEKCSQRYRNSDSKLRQHILSKLPQLFGLACARPDQDQASSETGSAMDTSGESESEE